jgi:hypothetical protein
VLAGAAERDSVPHATTRDLAGSRCATAAGFFAGLTFSMSNKWRPAMVRSTRGHWSALRRVLSCCSISSGRSRLPDPAIRVHAGAKTSSRIQGTRPRFSGWMRHRLRIALRSVLRPSLPPHRQKFLQTILLPATQPLQYLRLLLIRSRRQHARWSVSRWPCRFYLFRHVKVTRQAGIAPTRTYRRS